MPGSLEKGQVNGQEHKGKVEKIKRQVWKQQKQTCHAVKFELKGLARAAVKRRNLAPWRSP